MQSVKAFYAAIQWDQLILAGLRIILILAAAWAAMLILRALLHRMQQYLLRRSEEEGEPPSESGKRIETIARLVRQAVMLILWLTVGLTVLRQAGVEIGPVLASAGIAGVALGFGAQNLVRDVISGFFIILENQIRVGDVAIVNGTGGLVEKINFRTIVLRDQAGVVHIFPNGTISTLSNLTNEWSAYVFELGIAYKENTDRVVAVISEVCAALLADEKFGRLILEPPEIFGVERFDDSAVIIKGRIKTKPIRQWEVGREFLRRVKLAFDENHIEIPFPHRTIVVSGEVKSGSSDTQAGQ